MTSNMENVPWFSGYSNERFKYKPISHMNQYLERERAKMKTKKSEFKSRS